MDASAADRRLLVLVSALVAAAWIAATLTTVPAAAAFLDDVHWTLAGTAGAWFAWRGFRAEGSPTVLRGTRAFFALGMLAVFLGQASYDLQDYRGWQPFPSPSDGLYLLQGPFYLLGFVWMLRHSLAAGQGRIVMLDLTAFALAVLAFALTLYLPLSASSSPLQLAVMVGFPVVLLTAAVTALVTHLHLRFAWSASWQVLLLAMCLRGLLRMSWDLELSRSPEVAGSILNGGFSLVFLLQGWGSLVWRPERVDSHKFDHWCEAVLRQLPLLTIALTVAAIGLIAFEPSLGDAMRATLVTLSLTAVVLAVIRQTRQLAERDRLIQAEQELAESRARLEYLAHHDPLTGLPNRELLKQRVEHALASAQGKGLKAALLFLDCDQFKEINDTLGHVTGDALLCHLAGELQAALRATDTVSRQGGDEFAVVLPDVHDVDQVVRVAEKLLALSSKAVVISGSELQISLSVGIALYPDDGRDFATLLQCADTAMYRAKEAGRNDYRFYDARMHAEATSRVQMRFCLSRAIERGEVSLHYQPQIDLRSGALCGAEALLRWDCAELGSVSPARFIPLAEESGLILAIGNWVLEEACRQNARWQALGLPAIPVAANLSLLQFRRGDLHEQILAALEHSGLPPHLLELELTESVLMQDPDRVMAVIERLTALGVRFAIDDFGTGYSSLGHLHNLRVARLKIDRSFIRQAQQTPSGHADIVQAMIDMAHALQLTTVAEGVETPEQAAWLCECGCDVAQGYLYSAPLAPDAFERYVTRKSVIPLVSPDQELATK